ncbi:Psf2-domain-containing protein [Flagelloscypha sp. PMI_526]|nr:Psf2-domain-containing protein [Flagelloscypha sp. PMI_526]
MALPQPLRPSLSLAELELIASNEFIYIRPSISMEETHFINGYIQALVPPKQAKVPLWFALNLKSKRKCRILPPDWLNIGIGHRHSSLAQPNNSSALEYLEKKVAEETQEQNFSKLPFRYAETSKILLDAAPDDLEDPDRIRTLLKQLREARQAKSREGLKSLDHLELSLQNLSSSEINEIRPVFVRSMSILAGLTKEKPREDQFE